MSQDPEAEVPEPPFPELRRRRAARLEDDFDDAPAGPGGGRVGIRYEQPAAPLPEPDSKEVAVHIMPSDGTPVSIVAPEVVHRDDPLPVPDATTRKALDDLAAHVEARLAKDTAALAVLEGRVASEKKRIGDRRKVLRRSKKHSDAVAALAAELGFDPARPVTPVPPVPAGRTQVSFTTLEPDRVHIRVTRDDRTHLYAYELLEPPLGPLEREAFDFVRDTLVRILEPKETRDKATLEATLRDRIEEIIVDYNVLVDEIAKERISHHLVREFLGFGKLDPIMKDPMLEDISCDGPGIPLFLFHREHRSMPSNVHFANDEELDAYVIRLAQISGKAISIAEPILDATLPDGSRLQTTLAREVTTRGSSFTIRKIKTDPMTPPDLVRYGTISAEMAGLLWMAIENGKSLIMCGGTASGKTTALNALALFIPTTKKIITIEDTREITLLHENWIAGLTRKGFMGQTTGEVTMYRLLEAALRQRPDYLVVGEVRGVEAMTLFQAMATGHTTYSTMHAETVAAAVHRLEHPPINVPRIMLNSLDCLAVQAQVKVGNKATRRLKELTEIVGLDPKTDELIANTVFRWDSRTDRQVFSGRSYMLDAYGATHNLNARQVEAEWQRRSKVIRWMAEKGIRSVKDVWGVITAYAAAPDLVMQRIEANP